MLRFHCLPSFFILLHLGVTLFYGLPFRWIIYLGFVTSLFCMESIRVKKRGVFNVLFEETGSVVSRKLAKIKCSIAGEEEVKDSKGSSPTTSCDDNGGGSRLTNCNDCSSLGSSPSGDSTPSSYVNSPWSTTALVVYDSSIDDESICSKELIGSLVREEGHVYSLAVVGDLLYTGSDSKNIRVWMKQKEFSWFKSRGGLVKAIVVVGNKIFTGHRDGKIRVWKVSSKMENNGVHKRVGSLPTIRDYIKAAIQPRRYFEAEPCRRDIWLRHTDAVSCLSFNEDKTLLYSASWDKTFKVWRVSDWKCLESVQAHDDAVNSIVVGCDGLVFTGSADGTVKVWRRDLEGKGTRHLLSQTLLKQDYAITALAVSPDSKFVYCGSSDGLVNYWGCENHFSHGGAFRGHKLAVLCLVTAGNLVISGSADKTISIWKRTAGNGHRWLSTLKGHKGPIKCLAIEKDQESTENEWILYSGSLDKSVKIWRVSEEEQSIQSSNEIDSSDDKRTPTSSSSST
ncbi:hypothetical protein J1N35_006833 [Gossypium stocksii]|uniref:Anaphase-promoting complex subunit 4 WD40 domain-containing protein n=1 Tax=Gossypium stocksii TaxID=47602 RepID=A0A9D3W815_9ROSI|nr:hypothetical protein J1N35_006833 [Gossypium stocksii]